eukprot:GDKI01045646.1.p1 GENE.GDKI01045646.1~~GDKI01045646.1.p1  ORF type:complete len:116 (+),score=26.31 GDKI01045646.1:118-465(+)
MLKLANIGFAAGVGILLHAGYVIVEWRKRMVSLGIHEELSIPFEIVFQILLGVLLALWAGVYQAGAFKPIRITGSQKPSWDSLNARPDFRVFSHRGEHVGSLMREALGVPPPPKS